ncbi:hypothetical protein [Aureimonas mangrovi]|uniref:hypothetical protein n=1 Tax=Aureimonas mangrovi TaxID=2758041 RepID=UPI00163DA8DB|nr:hypothetical protein [Aureimonas mangrovi]
MNLLTLVQDVMVGLQLPKPATVIGNPDPSVAQMLAALGSAADDLVNRYPNNRLMPTGEWARGAGEMGVLKPAPTLDTDEILFDTPTIRAAITWRWRDWNGLDYAEAFRQSEESLSRAALRHTKANAGEVFY